MADRKRHKHRNLAVAVIDDWPDDLPITNAELELVERELLDIVMAMFQHS